MILGAQIIFSLTVQGYNHIQNYGVELETIDYNQRQLETTTSQQKSAPKTLSKKTMNG